MFECPSDYSLFELSDVLAVVRGIYDKLELVIEGYDPFDVFDAKRRWNRAPFPEAALILRRIRYGSRLKLFLIGSPQIRDLRPVLAIVSSIRSITRERGYIARIRKARKGFKKVMESLDPKTRESVLQLLRKYDFSLDRLLGYLGPELDDLYQNRATFRR